MILKKFKDIYNSAEAITCAGCHSSFKPVTFKCHLERCPMLQEDDAQPHLDDGKVAVKVEAVDSDGTVRFAVEHQGVAWVTDKIELSDIQYVARNLKKDFPNLSAFTKGSSYEQFLGITRKELAAGREVLEKFVQDLARYEVCINDLNLRTLLQINQKLEEAQRRQKFQSSSVSLLRIAKKNALV